MQKNKTILDYIIQQKKREILEAKNNVSLQEMMRLADQEPVPRGFIKAIQDAYHQGYVALIAEIKKASPSKGIIREHFSPVDIASIYQSQNVTCISVLTDQNFFHGHPDYIKQIKRTTNIPLLRKDFILDAYQVYESRYYGADAILLILSALTQSTYLELLELAHSLDLDVLVEVHNQEEMTIALESHAQLIGINNRNLQTFDVSLENTYALLTNNYICDRVIVSESGIETCQQVQELYHKGVHAILVGETFMRSPDIAQTIRNLMIH